MKSRTLNRRAFIRSGALFVPALLLPRKSIGQFASFNDRAFLAQGSSQSTSNGLLNGLVSYWKLGSPADSQDGNTLSPGNGAYNSTGGPISNGPQWSADGSSGILVASGNVPANLAIGSGKSFSMSLWGKTAIADHGNSGAIAMATRYCFGGSYLMYYFSTGVGWQMFNGGTFLNGVSFSPVNINVWQHYLYTYDSPSKTMQMYRNGVAGTSAICASDPTDGGNVNWGGYGAGTCGLFQLGGGERLAECGWWNRALNATDAVNLYNGGAGLPFSSFAT